MKYLVLMLIKIEKFPQYFIQIAQELDLSTHPNSNDEITVDEYFCRIVRISYDLKDQRCLMYLEAFDNLPHENEEDKVVQRLKDEAKEMEKYGWWLNDHDYCGR